MAASACLYIILLRVRLDNDLEFCEKITTFLPDVLHHHSFNLKVGSTSEKLFVADISDFNGRQVKSVFSVLTITHLPSVLGYQPWCQTICRHENRGEVKKVTDSHA